MSAENVKTLPTVARSAGFRMVPRGETGGGPSRIAVAGASGDSGAATVIQTSFNEIGQMWDPDHLTMLMHRIELDYLTGNYDICAARAAWLANVTAAQQGSVQATLNALAVTTIERLRLGLDFFGKPPGFVPLTTLEEINRLINGLLNAGGLVETSFVNYFNLAREDIGSVSDLQAAISEATNDLSSKRRKIDELKDARTAIEPKLVSFATELDRLSNEIPNLDSQFRDEVQNTSGCPILDCLFAIGTIVSVSAAAARAIQSIAVGVDVLPPGTHTSAQGRVAVLERIAGDVEGFRAKYRALKDASHPATFRDLDHTKLAMEQKKVDEMLQPYRNLASARALQDAVDRFCDVTQQRNLLLLDFTASFKEEESLRAEIVALEAKRDQLSAQLTTAELEASLSVSAKTFMGGIYLQAKYDICKALWQKRQILEYALLHDVNFEIKSDMNISVLQQENEHLNILNHDRLIESEQAYVPLDPPRSLLLLADSADAPQNLQNTAQLVLGEAFRKFISDGSGLLTFAIPLSCQAFPENFASIRLTGVDVRLLGAEVTADYGIRRINLDVVQQGISQFLSPMKEIRWFTHRARPAAISYDLDNPAPSSSANINLIGLDSVFTSVSPFGPWSIRVGKQSRSASIPPILPVLDNVSGVLMTFHGKHQPFDPSAPPGPVRGRRLRAR